MRVQLVTKEDITEALVTIPQNSLFSSITGRGKGVLAESGIISATGVSRLSITGTGTVNSFAQISSDILAEV